MHFFSFSTKILKEMVMNPNGVKIKEYGTNFHYDLSSTFVKFERPTSQNGALFENLMRVLFFNFLSQKSFWEGTSVMLNAFFI